MNFSSRKFKRLSLSPVFWVILSLLLVLIPHFPRLPVWMPIAIVILFIWRLSAINRGRILPKKWLLSCIAIIACIATIFHYGSIFGKTAGSAFLAILLAIKLLESHNKRDYMLLLGISFFIIVINFLFSQSITTVIYMFITIIVLVVSMISINVDGLDIDLQYKFKLSTRLVLQALPMMLILFVLFPRIPGPLWQLPSDSASARTGLSNTMSPGNISQLIQSNEVAFRVKFKDQSPSQNKLYWRAMVLWNFDGRTWEQGKTNINPSPILQGIDQQIEYTVTLEAHDRKYLFALDMPAYAPENSIYNADFLLRSKNKIDSLYQYTVASFLNYRIEENLSLWESNAGLKIPTSSNPKTIAMGRQWKEEFYSPIAIVNHALEYYNKNQFSYSLRPPLTPGFNPVDQFLFTSKKGFCEHYASSFTLLMRAAGVPARVVVGYQGGSINPINQFLTVRQSNAHAWAEVWLENRGWLRIDPTSAIAPERIERNLNSALSRDEYRPLYMYLSSGPLKNLMFYWDAIDNGWKQWVIGYDAKLQHKFLSSIFNKKMNLTDIVLVLVIILFFTTLIISLYIFKSTAKKINDPVQKIYNKFCLKLAHNNLPRHIYEGPIDFSSRAIERFSQQKNTIELITKIYIKLRFKSNINDKLLREMNTAVSSLRLKSLN
jgi:transglutaminase-like putative cysteine protease